MEKIVDNIFATGELERSLRSSL